MKAFRTESAISKDIPACMQRFAERLMHEASGVVDYLTHVMTSHDGDEEAIWNTIDIHACSIAAIYGNRAMFTEESAKAFLELLAKRMTEQATLDAGGAELAQHLVNGGTLS